MKSTALVLAAMLLLYSPVLALDAPSVVVEEGPQLVVPQRLTPLVEEEPAPATPNRPAVLVQDDSDSAPQAEPEQQPEQPPSDPPPEEQAQPEQQPPPEAPPPPEEQPEEQPQEQPPPEEPVPVPAPPETRRQSAPKVAQAAPAPYQLTESKPAPSAGVAPVQQAPAAPAGVSSATPHQHEFVEPEQQAAAPSSEPSEEPSEQNGDRAEPTYVSEIASDFRYTVNNAEADAEDIITAPLHIDKAGSLFAEPGFYYTVLGAGAALGGAFALDQTARAHVRHMGYGLADDLETGGNFFVYGGTGLLYLWGLQSADANLRETEITGAESSGIASLLTIAFKNGFGRLRPHEGHGHFAFFDKGDSFVSSAATPVFALAAAASEAYGNQWYVALPAYAGAAAVGVGRMGKDDHWLSDIVGSALLGFGTTELLLYMHRWHAENPSRFRIFPVWAPNSGAIARQSGSSSIGPQGLGVSYDW